MGSPLTRRRPGIPAIFLAVSTALSCLTPTLAADKVIDWTYGTGQGGNEFDILQCQAMSVDWSVGDGMRHSLYEFESEAAYNWCDFSKAKMLLGRSRRAEVELSGEETVDVATRWFGSRGNNASASLNSGGSDCSDGMMKFTLKTSPLLQFKFPGYMCKGNSLLVKKDDDIRDCRTWCKFHRDCVAIQYNAYRGICTIYSREGLTGVRTPFSSEILEASTCEVAITDCSGSEDTSSLGIEIPGGRNEIPGGRNNGPIPPPRGGRLFCCLFCLRVRRLLDPRRPPPEVHNLLISHRAQRPLPGRVLALRRPQQRRRHRCHRDSRLRRLQQRRRHMRHRGSRLQRLQQRRRHMRRRGSRLRRLQQRRRHRCHHDSRLRRLRQRRRHRCHRGSRLRRPQQRCHHRCHLCSRASILRRGPRSMVARSRARSHHRCQAPDRPAPQA